MRPIAPPATAAGNARDRRSPERPVVCERAAHRKRHAQNRKPHRMRPRVHRDEQKDGGHRQRAEHVQRITLRLIGPRPVERETADRDDVWQRRNETDRRKALLRERFDERRQPKIESIEADLNEKVHWRRIATRAR